MVPYLFRTSINFTEKKKKHHNPVMSKVVTDNVVTGSFKIFNSVVNEKGLQYCLTIFPGESLNCILNYKRIIMAKSINTTSSQFVKLLWILDVDFDASQCEDKLRGSRFLSNF